MLLHQTLHFEECWQQIPLVLRGIDRVGQRLVVVEWLQQCIEGIPGLVFGRMVVGLVLRSASLRSLGFIGRGRSLSFRRLGRRGVRILNKQRNARVSPIILWWDRRGEEKKVLLPAPIGPGWPRRAAPSCEAA